MRDASDRPPNSYALYELGNGERCIRMLGRKGGIDYCEGEFSGLKVDLFGPQNTA
jgi:hypothetical protein